MTKRYVPHTGEPITGWNEYTQAIWPDDWSLASCTYCRQSCEECDCPLCEFCERKVYPDAKHFFDELDCYCSDQCQHDANEAEYFNRREEQDPYSFLG